LALVPVLVPVWALSGSSLCLRRDRKFRRLRPLEMEEAEAGEEARIPVALCPQ